MIYQQFVGKTGGDSAENAPASGSCRRTGTAAGTGTNTAATGTAGKAPAPQPQAVPQNFANPQQQPMAGMQQPMYAVPPQDINIQPAQFQNFAQAPQLDGIAPENIDLIMDVPLEVTVELGRTKANR